MTSATQSAPGGQDGPDRISEDTLLGGRVTLVQPLDGYRAAIDPVLLAAAVPAAPGDSILDLGSGAGAASLCLLARVSETRLTGLELQMDLVRLSGVNGRANNLAARFIAMAGDVSRPPPRLAPGSFDHVMCNPPYHKATAARPSANPGRDLANREGTAGLSAWLGAALAMTRSRGSITVIHRAERLDELLAGLSGRAGDIAVFPLWPGDGKEAKRVIVQARKGSAAPLRVCPGLVLHEPNGAFTAEAQAILRNAAPLVI